MAKVYVFFADGFEEVEALTTVDLLRRANVEVVMTSIMGKNTVTGAQGLQFVQIKSLRRLILPMRIC